MNEATTFEPSATEDADLRAAVGQCIERIDLEREHITRNQTEVDQLQSETRHILERLRQLLPAA